ncbi:MAG: sorbosone dehydrogenase family protein [Gaiellaceae bacterium]
MRCSLVVALVVICGVLAPASIAATRLPPDFTQELVDDGLTTPTAMAFAPDGRLFVAEQAGSLRVIKDGTLLPTPFVTLPVDSRGERGLLGVTFDPDFATNKFVYVYYTTSTAPIHNRVSRFTASGDVALAGSETPILELESLSGATNHNGGAIHFGPDDMLYVAVGENANSSHSQTLGNRLGKMLRIEPDGDIPTDNPFYTTAVGDNRSIWALGLRNPYTFSFQPGSGRMFINDVGSVTWEEINDGRAGGNYGWPTEEGPGPDPELIDPIFYYGHGTGPTTGCAITGGSFYNPRSAQFPSEYVGDYFFADFCSGWIRRLDPATGAAADFASGISNPVDLAVGGDGSLYYLARGAGAVYRIYYAPPTGLFVRSFSARRSATGVVLTWRAESLFGQVLGYNVLRASWADARPVRVNRGLIPASPLSAWRHSFVDRRQPRGRQARYWLELVLADGTRARRGPALVRA